MVSEAQSFGMRIRKDHNPLPGDLAVMRGNPFPTTTMIHTNDTAAAQPTVSHRNRHGGENHHIWNNNGTWWVHFTLHLPDYTAQRIRKSLRTRDVTEARLRRDSLLAGFTPTPR